MATPELYLFNGLSRRRKVVARSKTAGARVRKYAAKHGPLEKGALRSASRVLRKANNKSKAVLRRDIARRKKLMARVRSFRAKSKARKNPMTASARSMIGGLIRKNPRRRARLSLAARTKSGAKKMASRRRKRSLPRNAKGHFIKRGARKSASRRKSSRKRRARRNPLTSVARAVVGGLRSNPRRKKRRKSRARRNPVRMHRRHRARRNPTRISRQVEASVLGGGKSSKPRKRRKHAGSSALVRRLTAKIHRIEGGRKRAKSRRWSPSTSRLAVLKARRRVASGKGLPAGARAYLSSHGLSRVRNNPSMAGAMQGLNALVKLIPEVAVGGGSLLAIGWVGNWGGQKLVAKWGASWAPFASAGVSLASSILGFLGLRMLGATAARMSVPLLMGGVSGAIVNGLASVHGTAPEGGVALSLGRQLGLPIGDALTPGLSLGLDLHGAYLPRQDFNGAYLPRQDLNGAYLPRKDFNGLRGYLPVGATGDGQNQNVASTPGKLRALLNDHMDKMGDGPGF